MPLGVLLLLSDIEITCDFERHENIRIITFVADIRADISTEEDSNLHLIK